MAHPSRGPRVASSLLVALAFVGAMLASCKQPGAADGAASTAAEAPAGSSSLAPEQAKKVLARVGERVITLGDFAATVEHLDAFDRLRYQSPERRKELLDEMINVELLAQEAEAKGYDKDPFVAQAVREILRDAMLAEARKGAAKPGDLPLEEVKAYFDAHRDEYRDPERRRISLIVTADEASGRPVLEAARKATPAEWGALVKTKSIDPQAKAEGPADLAGDVGFITPPGDAKGKNPRVPEAVRAAAYEIGAIGETLPRLVVDGGKGYVVKLVQKAAAHERTFPEAERSIRIKLSQERLKAQEDAALEQLKAEVPVQIDEAALARVKVSVTDAGLALPPLPPSSVVGGHSH